MGWLAAALGLASASVPLGTPLDGMWLRDMEGRLVRDGERWLFVPADPARQGSTVIGSGRILELLPSSVLEAVAAGPAQRPEARYLLSGQVQVYRDRSYLFATAASLLNPPPASGQADANDPVTLKVRQGTDPNRSTLAGATGAGPEPAEGADPLAIPAEIQKRLAEYEVTRQRSTGTALIPVGLHVLVDEVGLIVPSQGKVFFVTDPLGLNAMPSVFELLPCRTLESMERVQSQSPEPARFRVAGLVTEYRRKPCLLLHRAVHEYDYGNLGR